MKEAYLVITFESTHHAIKAEKVLEGLEIEIIPTPRQLNSNCGISIKAETKDFEVIKSTMGDSYGVMNQCYQVSQIDDALNFKKL